MSSTQKSSEIGDYVDTTLVSGHHQQDVVRRHKLEEAGSSTEECDRNNNHSSDDGSQIKTDGVAAPHQSKQNGKKPIKSQLITSKSGRRSARALEFDKLERAGVDQEFLRRYKKMSPSERKQELLRQRSMLLEEQKRLKLLLAAQEAQLKMKQMDALKKMDETDGLSEKDRTEIITMNSSLKAMEQDLKKKDQELHRSQNISARHHSSETSPRDDQRPDDDKQNVSSSTRRGQPLLGAESNGDVLKADAELSGESEMKLNGKDGDECVVYVSEVKERVVKKLDYSQQSDTESNASSRKVSSRVSRDNLSGSASTEAVVSRDRPKGGNRDVMSSPPQHSDASTSVSYSHLPRYHKHTTETDWKVCRSKSTRSVVSNTKEKHVPSRTYNSIGEITLSVLDIINAMDDPHQISPVKDIIKTDGNKIHDDIHKIYDDRHDIHDDTHKIYDDRQDIHDDKHKSYDDIQDTHDDKHKIYDDRYGIHDDRHKIYDDRYDIHDDRHKIYDDRYDIHDDRHKVCEDTSDLDSRHTCNIKHKSEPNINLSNCSQQSSSLLHISRSSVHQNHARDGVHSELPPTKKPSVKSGQINHSMPPADADPHLSLFVLRRNLSEISPRPIAKCRKINTDKDRGLRGIKSDDEDGSSGRQLSEHHDFETLDRVMSPHGVHRVTSRDDFQGLDIMLQTIDAIDDGRPGLLDGNDEVCLSDLEESKILEEVFFI
ncbi:unnamed protein product [Lymnaea stagnalis]|uniref:Uncharacterized protein n=1 Tax=Lymnaea stagnalis TaxID=6523 RepID=A0AAV2H9V8_LYMST